MHADLTGLPAAFLTSEAATARLDARRLRTAVARGRVIRVGRGVYGDPSRWPDDPVERHRLVALAAHRAVEDCALSHVSAALVMGLPNPRTPLPRPSVTVDDGIRSRSPGSWMTLFRGELPEGHVEVVDGVRRTIVPRTVADCARHLSLGDGLAIADASVRAGLTTVDDVRAVREFQRRWPGSLGTQAVLALLDPRREGWLESWSAAAFQCMGLPRWVPQVDVHDAHGRFVGRVDGLWPELGVVAEADGRGKYLGDVDPALDRSPAAVAQRVLAAGNREVALRSCGLGVVRWTTEEITRQQLRVAVRWRDEVQRTEPRGIRASLTCTCCQLPVTSCDIGAVFAPSAA
ncbi:hypothetical protein GCM10023168_31790 [Fodinibacter luteus]|uniref:Type IV toxin-antitoxin system AbiEi family antitoxin domain-containing protein n=1 Tax=Fodinibacter luteus TaxID=552064 RepID=A0ABP8KMU9_9MICO